MSKQPVECGPVVLTEFKRPTIANTDPEPDQPEYEVIAYEGPPPRDPSKTGNKPKQLKAIEVYGYEVGRGNRKKIVSPEDVYKLASIGCTDAEIATWFDIDYNTLRYNFSDIMAKGRQDLKTALRTAMIKNAINGNAALQIFLSKNLLGYSDNPTNTEDSKPLPWTDDE
jgi:hypothetical protein